MTSTMKPSPRKFQETASAMLRNMAPLLAKARSLSFKKMLMPSPETNRSIQQTELIKWQQETFHRILNTMCLVQDSLVDVADLEALREEIIRTLIAVHPNGEWADFTRDKLLFLQDLFQARCISADDYHAAKQPLLERLAEQGARLDSQDFKSISTELRAAEESRVAAVSTPPILLQEETPEASFPTEAGDSGSAKKKTPIKHVMDAVSRLKSPTARKMLDLSYFEDKQSKEGAKPQAKVPHALDFLRPPNCPTRDPPVTPANQRVLFESPLFKESSIGSTRDLLPELSSDTTDLLPHLSNLSMDDASSPASVPAPPPPPAAQSKASLGHSTSLTPSKLSFTPRSALTPTKSCLGRSNSSSRNLPLSASPKGKLDKSLTRKFSGLLRGWQKAEAGRDSEGSEDEVEEKERVTPKKSVWKRMDLLGGGSSSKKRADDDDDFGKEISDKDPLLVAIRDYPAEKVNNGFIHGQGPNVKKLKKKVSVRAAPTNFFIDQVLGDNIKSELDRIREEMARSNPGSHQTFTNEQIDAIATRLPVDKNELMRFFPKAWCDRYGDIVLEVVHKEFKCHVSEMDGLRKAAKEKRKSRLRDPENDENNSFQTTTTSDMSLGPNKPPPSSAARIPSKPPVTKVYTTEGSEFKGASVHEQQQQPADYWSPVDRYSQPFAHTPGSGGRGARRGLGYEELDVKLGAEILRMPFRNFNESTRF